MFRFNLVYDLLFFELTVWRCRAQSLERIRLLKIMFDRLVGVSKPNRTRSIEIQFCSNLFSSVQF